MPSTKRDQILERAVSIASVEGLEGLTIGRLAGELNMSKSGLFGHFGSKEDLQLAAIKKASEIFEQRVITPAVSSEAGLDRARAITDNWLDYLADGFEGGCFFHAASLEFDGRPGRVKDEIARVTGRWYVVLEEQLRRAITRGQLASDTDATLMAFELHALLGEANWAFRLFGRPEALSRARVLLHSKLAHAQGAGERRTA